MICELTSAFADKKCVIYLSSMSGIIFLRMYVTKDNHNFGFR